MLVGVGVAEGVKLLPDGVRDGVLDGVLEGVLLGDEGVVVGVDGVLLEDDEDEEEDDDLLELDDEPFAEAAQELALSPSTISSLHKTQQKGYYMQE